MYRIILIGGIFIWTEKNYKMIVIWTGILEDQEKSNLSMSRWCARNHTAISTFGKKKKIIKEFMEQYSVSTYGELRALAERSHCGRSFREDDSDSGFYSVDLTGGPPGDSTDAASASKSGVRLLKNGFVIEVDPCFDENTLRRIMAVIGNA